MSADSETLAVYSRKAEEYAALMAGYGKDPGIEAFIKLLEPGARVLDLGCGPGHAAARMAQAGLCVEAVDAVPEMVAMAAAHPGVSARVGQFDEIGGQGLYAGVWANFSLLHAPRAQMPGHLAQIHAVLQAEGWLHLGLKLGEGEARDRLGRLYTYYSIPDLSVLLADAAFDVRHIQPGRGKGLDGSLSDWVVIRARRVG